MMKFLVKLCADGESNNGDRVCRMTNTLYHCCYFSDMYQLVLWCQKQVFLNTNWNIEQQIYPLFLSNFISEGECNCLRKHFCWSINQHGLMQIKRNCCHSFVPLGSIGKVHVELSHIDKAKWYLLYCICIYLFATRLPITKKCPPQKIM